MYTFKILYSQKATFFSNLKVILFGLTTYLVRLFGWVLYSSLLCWSDGQGHHSRTNRSSTWFGRSSPTAYSLVQHATLCHHWQLLCRTNQGLPLRDTIRFKWKYPLTLIGNNMCNMSWWNVRTCKQHSADLKHKMTTNMVKNLEGNES